MRNDIYNYVFEDIYNLDEDKEKIAFTFKGVKYTFDEVRLSVNYLSNLLIEKGVKNSCVPPLPFRLSLRASVA